MKRPGIAAPFFWCLLLGQPLLADQVSEAGRQFLLLPQDARESAMGGSFVAFPDGAMDLFSNPAALVCLPRDQLSLSHLSWFGGTNEESASYARVLEGKGVIAAGLSLYWVPSFDNTGGTEAAISSMSYQGVLGYGGRFGLKDLAWGAALRYVGTSFGGLEKIDDLGIDLGLFYGPDGEALKLGAAIKNINLLTSAKGGFPFLLGLGASLGDEDKLISMELDRSSDQGIQGQLGGEIWLAKVVAFRAGIRVQDGPDSPLQPSLGVGVRLGRNYRFDYAMSNLGDLGVVHWITAGIFFGEPKQVVAPRADSRPLPGARHPHEGAKAAKPPAARVVVPIPGGFPIQARVVEATVNLSWNPQILSGFPAGGYNVYGSLVPEAGFKKMTDKPVALSHWSGEIGLRGITYYFKVTTIGADGQETRSSEVKGVEIP